jgi:hypothetical protein
MASHANNANLGLIHNAPEAQLAAHTSTFTTSRTPGANIHDIRPLPLRCMVVPGRFGFAMLWFTFLSPPWHK